SQRINTAKGRLQRASQTRMLFPAPARKGGVSRFFQQPLSGCASRLRARLPDATVVFPGAGIRRSCGAAFRGCGPAFLRVQPAEKPAADGTQPASASGGFARESAKPSHNGSDASVRKLTKPCRTPPAAHFHTPPRLLRLPSIEVPCMSRTALIVAVLTLSAGASIEAQPDRIHAPITSENPASIPGHLRTLSRAAVDEGPLAPSFPMDGMTVFLKPSPQQQAGLTRLLLDLQNPRSASYHR